MRHPTQNILHHWREAVPDDRLAHLIRDTERAFRRALQIRLARYGVPFGHWVFLRILWVADGLTQRELSGRAGVMEPTTFAAMKAMESLGYISRTQLPGNKKNVYVYLTDAGRALQTQLVPLAEDTNRISSTGLSPHDLSVARRVLLAMIDNLAQDEAGQLAEPASNPVPQCREKQHANTDGESASETAPTGRRRPIT